jgi:hypothetical protein
MMKNNKQGKRISKPEASLPLYCDYSCSYAKFAQPDAVGACRRDLAVYCKKFKRYNNKNSRCFGITP